MHRQDCPPLPLLVCHSGCLNSKKFDYCRLMVNIQYIYIYIKFKERFDCSFAVENFQFKF